MEFLLSANHYCLFIWIIIPTFIYFALDRFFIHAELSGRYIGFLQIPILLLVSCQINNYRGLIKSMLVSVIVVMAMSNAYLFFRGNIMYPPPDWRRTAQELTQDLGKNDIVLSFFSTPMIKYYYKGDTDRIIKISEKNCSSENLVKRGILTPRVQSIFLLYNKKPAFEIKLNGFFLDYKVSNGGAGFLHFRRIPSNMPHTTEGPVIPRKNMKRPGKMCIPQRY